MTPQRVTVTVIGPSARRVVLACACVTVGRIASMWESDAEVIDRLRLDHRERAPLCRHPEPVARPWSVWEAD